MGKNIDWQNVSLKAHRLYRGKIEVLPRVPIRNMRHFSIWYTPGVAAVSKYIHEVGGDEALELTWRGNLVAVISDGTRVLGLGNIGPEAALPVMEGKALLFKYLGGVDAVPLVVRSSSADEFIEIVKAVSPSFGGINLEDIESPKCFYILDRLRQELDIPVWHDDQQGTAVAVLAGLINAFKIVGKDLKKARIALVGLGAANYAVLKILEIYGVDLGNIIVVEKPGIGILSKCHPMLEEFKKRAPHWYEAAIKTNRECIEGGIDNALEGADALIAASRPGPNVIMKEWIKAMAKDPIVFTLANPVPEIWPWEAKKAGARVVATGRSDLPNQVNNSLVFPAVFRGALSVRAKKITDKMLLAASKALAEYVEEKGLREDYILPSMSEYEVFIEEALAVARQAIMEGVARRKLDEAELFKEIRMHILRAREYMDLVLGKLIIEHYF